MRRVRRFAALVTSVLLTNFVMASGATACPTGDDWPSPAVSAAAAHGVEHPGSATGRRESAHGRHDTSPTRPAHHHIPGGSHCTAACPPSGCAGMSHCGSASLTDEQDEGSARFAAANKLAIARTIGLRSVSTAPDPPPPRA